MKVLHIEAGRRLYGGAAQVLMLLRELRHHGDEHVLVSPPDSAIDRAAQQAGLRRLALTLHGELDLFAVRRLARVFQDEGADLVHVHSRRGVDLWAGMACRRLAIPAVLSRRVDNPENRFSRYKYRYYARVIAISRAIAELLVTREQLDPERVECIPSAVDTQRFCPPTDKSAAQRRLRHEFKLPERGAIIAIVAQLIERKGHHSLLAAMPSILQQHPDCHLLIFGRGPRRDALQSQAGELEIQSHLRFAGLRADMDELLPGCDVLVHPAFQEGLGVALLEAAACGLPIVAGRAGGIPEIVHDGENGLLITPGDIAQLSESVCTLLDHPNQGLKFGRRGREIVNESFSIARMAEQNYRVYQHVLRDHR